MGKKMPETMALIEKNILQYSNPLAVSAKENAQWAEGLHLPKQGDVLFYTGGEYQLLPFIDSLLAVMDLLNPSSKAFGWLMTMRDLVNKTGLAPEKIYASVFAQDKNRFFAVNRKAARILQLLGYNIAYNGEKEIYSGALLFELGFLDAAKLYQERMADFVVESGAKTIVCMSPHAADVLKLEYPKLGGFPEVEVKTFIELVYAKRDLLPVHPTPQKVVIHDSCRMARELGIVDELRTVLDAMKVPYVEAFRYGAWTTCCGGPIKTTYAELAHKVAQKRYVELAKTGAGMALVSCPYCLSALLGADKQKRFEIKDMVEMIGEAYKL